jgi:beta-carotene/zeaxanthin 4-ketolase
MKKTNLGIVIALTIMILWFTSLTFLLLLPKDWILIALIPGILIQTHLYTGLFITAHDAMHGTVAPNHTKLNDAIGSISVFLYALFFYKQLKAKHYFHHEFPGTEKDPDFHTEGKPGFFQWYVHFLLNYLRWPQLMGMAIIFNILHHIAAIPLENLLLFWVAPSLLSTFQLFYFGTFLPHRRTGVPFPDQHNAHSLNFSKLASLFSCYHFGGFHHKHHLKPSVEWWRLAK